MKHFTIIIVLLLCIFVSQSFASVNGSPATITKQSSHNRLNLEGTQELVPVKGIVTDVDGNPIRNVSIYEKGTNNGTTTATDGSYTINVSSVASTLVFTSVGYITQASTVSSNQQVNIVLL